MTKEKLSTMNVSRVMDKRSRKVKAALKRKSITMKIDQIRSISRKKELSMSTTIARSRISRTKSRKIRRI